MNKKVKEFLDKSSNYEVIEYIGNLQQENKQLKEKLDYDLQWAFKYDKLVGNWNKLKKQEIGRFNESQDVQFLDVLQDMQELEQGGENDG